MSLSPWYVYILRCSDDSLYTGVTTDLARRVEEHNQGSRGARYTRARRPVQLVYHEEAENRSIAQRREYAIRTLPGPAKRRLIRADGT